MKLRHQLKYDAPPDEVYAMLSDPKFRERVCEALDVVSSDISIDGDDTSMSVRIDMVQHTQGVPGFAKKVVGEETRVIQSERWSDGEVAELHVEIPGKPGHVRGRTTLVGDSSGTIESFEGEATINIPLIGGKLEKLIEKLFVEGMDTEQGVGARWLAGDRL